MTVGPDADAAACSGSGSVEEEGAAGSVVDVVDASDVGSADDRGVSLSSVAFRERPKNLRSRSRMPMDETPHLSSAMRVRHGR